MEPFVGENSGLAVKTQVRELWPTKESVVVYDYVGIITLLRRVESLTRGVPQPHAEGDEINGKEQIRNS